MAANVSGLADISTDDVQYSMPGNLGIFMIPLSLSLSMYLSYRVFMLGRLYMKNKTDIDFLRVERERRLEQAKLQEIEKRLRTMRSVSDTEEVVIALQCVVSRL